MKQRLGFLGPKGTFTEEIARLYAGNDEAVILKEYVSIGEVIEDVAAGDIEEGIVPLENSLEGSVNVTLDVLAKEKDVYIKREIIYPISHYLLALSGTEINEISEVYSHPQAFSQCRHFLKEKFSRATLIPLESTAAAAVFVSSSEEGKAAIAPERSAALFGLQILASEIQDGRNGDINGNVTRFAVVAKEDSPPVGKNKTSIILSIKDGPGSLYNVLGIFAAAGINLTKIESRPSRKALGEYLFFIDFEGHRKEDNVDALFKELKSKINYMKMLGSYPLFESGNNY